MARFAQSLQIAALVRPATLAGHDVVNVRRRHTALTTHWLLGEDLRPELAPVSTVPLLRARAARVFGIVQSLRVVLAAMTSPDESWAAWFTAGVQCFRWHQFHRAATHVDQFFAM